LGAFIVKGSSQSPQISVVIPTRDRREKIIRCLESLTRQTFTRFEIIVVNDGSNDDTESCLNSFATEHPDLGVYLIHHPAPRGANPSRNEAIRASQGELIAFLDDDCIAEPQWLEKLQEPFVNTEVAAASGHVENIALSNIWERFFIGQQRVSSRQANAGVLIANRLVACNMLVRPEFLHNALDEDRANAPANVATSARGDEEGLRLKILRAGKLIAHAPDAICLHDHPYNFRNFCGQAFKSGRSTARLASKYRLSPRWELVALLASIFFLPFSFWRTEALAISVLSFCIFLAAVLYNELALKRKTVIQTITTIPALLIYFALRATGYLAELSAGFITRLIPWVASVCRQLARLPCAMGFRGLIRYLQHIDREQCRSNRPTLAKIRLPGSRQRMIVDRSDRMGSQFFWFGRHHWQQINLAERLLPSDGVFMDVGANMGEFAVAMAVKKPGARVLAIEPNPGIRPLLQNNIEANDLTNVSVFELALGDKVGTQELYSSGDSALVSCVAFTPAHQPIESIEVVTLDELFASQNLTRLDLLKIDVEGYELKVLSGAKQTLARYRPHIILEVNAITSQAAGFDVADLYELLRTYHYRFYAWRSRAWREITNDFPTQEDVWAAPTENASSEGWTRT
jgi:FkbM family methyltransferase